MGRVSRCENVSRNKVEVIYLCSAILTKSIQRWSKDLVFIVLVSKERNVLLTRVLLEIFVLQNKICCDVNVKEGKKVNIVHSG